MLSPLAQWIVCRSSTLTHTFAIENSHLGAILAWIHVIVRIQFVQSFSTNAQLVEHDSVLSLMYFDSGRRFVVHNQKSPSHWKYIKLPMTKCWVEEQLAHNGLPANIRILEEQIFNFDWHQWLFIKMIESECYEDILRWLLEIFVLRSIKWTAHWYLWNDQS